MVRGQAIFQEWFKDFENQYVLIGGTAACRVCQGASGYNSKVYPQPARTRSESPSRSPPNPPAAGCSAGSCLAESG
mgnify:CR=1 FL=1